MEIGNQIKTLRLRRGITQEEMAQHFGVTPQAVSKWERGAAAPDIGMLPDISAYFGVTIDALFALSDDTRMERIQNMLWDVRFLDQSDVDSAREFLLNKAQREPKNGRSLELLADMELHLADEHKQRAEEYAKEALHRDPTLKDALNHLVHAMNGKFHDWNYNNHYKLIDYYKELLARNPDNWGAYLWLLDQLIDDCRFDEARLYWRKFAEINSTYRVPLYEGEIAWYSGDKDGAFRIWEKMEQDFPDEWCVWHNVGDFLVRSGRTDEAMAYYHKALEVQKAPRLLDPCDAMAQLYEIQGDCASAVAIRKEELELLETEWNITTGETADIIRREIDRLEWKIGNTTIG